MFQLQKEGKEVKNINPIRIEDGIHTIEIMGMGVYAQYDFVNSFSGNHHLASWIVFGVRLVLVIGGTFVFVWAKDLVTNVFKKEEI